MGLFSKTPKPNPKIIVEDIEIEFHRDHEWWGFTYRGTVFRSFELSLILPTKAELDEILDAVGSLLPEMRSRIKKELSEYGDDVKSDDSESYSVDIEHFATEGSFMISWSGGASWGDLAVDFTIHDRKIIEEAWGD
jgi:hypothetical protein